MGLGDFLRDKIRNFLQIQPAPNQQIVIRERLDFYGNIVRNQLWYRGESQELSDFYSQLDAPPTLFWKARSTKGMEIRKIHVGIPKLMVQVLTNIVTHDFNGLEFGENDQAHSETWDKIAKDNDFDELLETAVEELLIGGDGAFKISFDKDVSPDYPIIEYYPGENVDFVYKRGRIIETRFLTSYIHKNKSYTLRECYGRGYIRYQLLDSNGHMIPINSILQTAWMDSQGVTFDKSVALAVPVKFGKSKKYEGRGESLFDGKSDTFDALDEAWSQWMDALRAGRSKQYIPENLIPRDPNTGKLVTPNSFDNRYIMTGNDVTESGSGNRIYNEQAAIPHDSYLATYITALDLALQGVISPSTLGIDVKKLDNAEAQREKEKTTLYTRGKIIEVLDKALPQLAAAAVCGLQIWHDQSVEKPEVKVKFGEYANPSFESQIETVAKGKAGKVISTETAVEELYGDSKDKAWKAEEVKRIKEEAGIVNMGDLPAVGADGID